MGRTIPSLGAVIGAARSAKADRARSEAPAEPARRDVPSPVEEARQIARTIARLNASTRKFYEVKLEAADGRALSPTGAALELEARRPVRLIALHHEHALGPLRRGKAADQVTSRVVSDEVLGDVDALVRWHDFSGREFFAKAGFGDLDVIHAAQDQKRPAPQPPTEPAPEPKLWDRILRRDEPESEGHGIGRRERRALLEQGFMLGEIEAPVASSPLLAEVARQITPHISREELRDLLYRPEVLALLRPIDEREYWKTWFDGARGFSMQSPDAENRGYGVTVLNTRGEDRFALTATTPLTRGAYAGVTLDVPRWEITDPAVRWAVGQWFAQRALTSVDPMSER